MKQRDHLIDALRYATMCKRKGKQLTECEPVSGYGGPIPFGAQRQSQQVQYADTVTDVFER